MVIADPSAELVQLVRRQGDPASVPVGEPISDTPAVTGADRRAALLIRRRFGLSLPPPFAGTAEADMAVRVATAMDGPAIAAVKWRAFGASYRGGVLPDAFLDGRAVVPPASFWTGRAMVPPSRRHRLFVWGRPGTVFGYLDCGPVHPDDATPGSVAAGEVYELYVDPSAQGRGGGSLLLSRAEDWMAEVGFERQELSVLALNTAAQAFYCRRGWGPTGVVTHVDLGSVAFDEARFQRLSHSE